MTRIKKTRKINSPSPKRKISRFELDTQARELKKKSKRTHNAGIRNNINILQDLPKHDNQQAHNQHKPSKTKLIPLTIEDELAQQVAKEQQSYDREKIEYLVKDGRIQTVTKQKKVTKHHLNNKLSEPQNSNDSQAVKQSSKQSITKKITTAVSSKPIKAEKNVVQRRQKLDKLNTNNLLKNWNKLEKKG